jgi:hypothetical protein
MIFSNLTVMENLQMGAYLRRDRAGIAADLEFVLETFPRLRERSGQQAGTLGLQPESIAGGDLWRWLGVAVCAVLGHMFSPWVGFRGGKGVATGSGALLAGSGVRDAGVLACVRVRVCARVRVRVCVRARACV